MEFTKGEWRVCGTVLGGHGVIIGKHSINIPTENHQGDAHLIASAPNLDNALRLVLWDLENLNEVSDLTIKVAEQAIAKKEGK